MGPCKGAPHQCPECYAIDSDVLAQTQRGRHACMQLANGVAQSSCGRISSHGKVQKGCGRPFQRH